MPLTDDRSSALQDRINTLQDRINTLESSVTALQNSQAGLGALVALVSFTPGVNTLIASGGLEKQLELNRVKYDPLNLWQENDYRFDLSGVSGYRYARANFQCNWGNGTPPPACWAGIHIIDINRTASVTDYGELTPYENANFVQTVSTGVIVMPDRLYAQVYHEAGDARYVEWQQTFFSLELFI